MLSGEGAARFYNGTNHKDENECRRAPTAYAALIVTEGDDGDPIPDDRAVLACSGAKGVDIYQHAQHAGNRSAGRCAPSRTGPESGALTSSITSTGCGSRATSTSS
jgi:hypothetical protein